MLEAPDTAERNMPGHHYIHHSLVPLEQVLPVIGAAIESEARGIVAQRAEFNGIRVGVKSLRLRTFFLKGTVCANCGRAGTAFGIDRTKDTQSHHLNLWSIDPDGSEYLMTHDHILARALGGTDHISNTQTLCSRCNANKSVAEGKLARQQRNTAKPHSPS